MAKIFETICYSKDYYLNGKLLGYVTLKEKDRKILGYYGRQTETLTEPIKIGKHKLKAGTTVVTELIRLQGKRLPDFKIKV